jgi:hypothetical protein
MVSHKIKRAIGLFPSREIAEQALKELKDRHFALNKISVLTKDPASDQQLLNTEDLSKLTPTRSEGIKMGASAGAATGGLFTLAAGIAALLVPGIGLVLAAESVLTVLLGSATVAGVGGLIGALEGWYIPEKQAKYYNDRLSQGDYLVTLEGTESEIHQAEEILNRWNIQEWRVFAPPTI